MHSVLTVLIVTIQTFIFNLNASYITGYFLPLNFNNWLMSISDLNIVEACELFSWLSVVLILCEIFFKDWYWK